MKVISHIENYDASVPCVLTIGTFDGVHLGHRKIINRLVKQAKQKKILAVVLTFFPHPRMVLQKDNGIRLIDTLEEKKECFSQLGIDVLVIHPFTKSFSRQTSTEFIKDVLVKTFHIKYLIIGYDHRFGRNREATVDTLINAGKHYNFEVEKIEAQEIESVNVSSTKIRTALKNGEMEKAAKYLQRPFQFRAKVIHGEKIGTSIGFPTANLAITEEYKLLPKDGAYLIRSIVHNQLLYGMMNIGFRPTISGKKRSVEVHFFDFSQMIYGCELQIDCLYFLRPEIKFTSVHQLSEQLLIDRAECLKLIPAF